MKQSPLRRIGQNPGAISFLASLISIFIGLLFGFILLLILNAKNAPAGMWNMLSNGIKIIGNVLYTATPLVMVGLAVAFAFKVGLFNIGASGQYTIGAVFSLYVAIELQLPWYLCLIAAMIGGAVWGFFPGLFKALFNVNEVITAIMMNWIGMNLANFFVANRTKMLAAAWGASSKDRTAALAGAKGANPSAVIPKLGLNKLFGYTYLNAGIIIAIVIAVVMWIILTKTTFGYELRACGLNKNAAIYAGINAKRNVVLSMVIAGALAGIGGGLYYLSGGPQFVMEQKILSTGFDGISVALLANSHPVGCIFSAIFIAYLRLGGIAMQSQGYATEATDIVISVIIYLAAVSLLIKLKLTSLFNKGIEVSKR